MRAQLRDQAWRLLSGRDEPWDGSAESEAVERIAGYLSTVCDTNFTERGGLGSVVDPLDSESGMPCLARGDHRVPQVDREAVERAALEAIQQRISWPSLHWGVEDVHPDAWLHVARAAVEGVLAAALQSGVTVSEVAVQRRVAAAVEEQRQMDLAMHEAYRPEVVAEVAVQLTEESDWDQIAAWCGGQIRTGSDPSGEYTSELVIPGVGTAWQGSWITRRHDLLFTIRANVEGPSQTSATVLRTAAAVRAGVEYVRRGVCLLCGGAVLNSGEHLDPQRHTNEVERITSGTTRRSDPALHVAEEVERAAAALRKDLVPNPFQPLSGWAHAIPPEKHEAIVTVLGAMVAGGPDRSQLVAPGFDDVGRPVVWEDPAWVEHKTGPLQTRGDRVVVPDHYGDGSLEVRYRSTAPAAPLTLSTTGHWSIDLTVEQLLDAIAAAGGPALDATDTPGSTKGAGDRG